jgi:hypothetical protein
MSGTRRSGRRSVASLCPEGSQAPWTMQQVHLHRWYYVRYAIRHKGQRIVDDSAYEYAAKAVADTPAKGGAAAMKQSYMWVQKRTDQLYGVMGIVERAYI